MLALERLVGKECEQTVLSLDLTELSCYKLLISKLIGIGIVFGSSILKVPQIVKILSSGSAKGVSFSSYLLETISCTIAFVYNFRRGSPFTTYGEGVFILLQNLFVLILMLSYRKRIFGILSLICFYSVFVFALYDESIVDADLLLKLQWSTLFIGVSSKLPQIWDNFISKSTGQLSLITTFLQFAGSSARVFTTIQEVSDPAILSGFLAMSLLNGIVLIQIVIYWKQKVVSDQKSRKNK